MIGDILYQISKAVVEYDTPKTKELIKNALDRGIAPLEIIMKGLVVGLDVVGKKYDDGEYFLPELIAAGSIVKECLGVLEPYLKGEGEWRRGSVVIGTVQGDLHDIGKNLVSMMLGGSFKVKDLGIDVPASKFVNVVKEERPDILALSCLLTTAMPRFSEVTTTLENERLREGVKVLVGGKPVTADYARSIGADGYAPDAIKAVKVARDLTKS